MPTISLKAVQLKGGFNFPAGLSNAKLTFGEALPKKSAAGNDYTAWDCTAGGKSFTLTQYSFAQPSVLIRQGKGANATLIPFSQKVAEMEAKKFHSLDMPDSIQVSTEETDEVTTYKDKEYKVIQVILEDYKDSWFSKEKVD